jgi:hypothetical protein
MPRVFRAMRRDADGLPHVEPSASGLGVRPGVDIDIDPNGDVLVNGKGMSVSPNWRDLPLFRIPERLRPLKPGARGSNNTSCFRSGAGPFQREAFAEGLALEPDSATHGAIAPARVMPLGDYQSALETTRPDWQVDET